MRSENAQRDTVSVNACTRQEKMPNASGAPGSGAPFGRRNGNYRHGRFTAEAKEQRCRLRSLIRDARKMVRSLV